MFGSRPQPSSAEKIAAAESELEMITGMVNRYALPQVPTRLQHFRASIRIEKALTANVDSTNRVPRSACPPTTENPTSTRASPSAWTDA